MAVEIKSIEEITSEDVKKLEDTMAVEGIAPMISKSNIPEDEESLADIVSRGIEQKDEIVSSMEDFVTQVHVNGIGEVTIPLEDIEKKESPVVTNASRGNRVFDSGLKVIKTHNEKVPISVPQIIMSVCNSLQKKVGGNEFSIVCKGRWGEDGDYIVDEDYKVPRQKVDGAAVDYDLEHLEELKQAGYNTVIHSHPFKSSNFSSSDDETINSHFDCSILYSVNEFTTATITVMPVPGTKLVITGNPIIDGIEDIVPKTESDNIEKKYKYNYDYRGWDDYNWNGGYYNNKHTRNGSLIGSDPDECEKEYDRNKGNYNKFHNDDIIRKGPYTYDSKNDVFLKHGKPVNRDNGSRVIYPEDPTSIPIRVHNGGGVRSNAAKSTGRKVFRTDEIVSSKEMANPKSVFTTVKSNNNHSLKNDTKKNNWKTTVHGRK